MDNQPNNPLHGVKLAEIVEHLVEKFGWEELGTRININCFNSNPSIKSSLKFLRRTPWAREKVERLYLQSIGKPSVGKQPPRKQRIETPEPQKSSEEMKSDSPWEAAKRVRESRD